ncbi:MAG TPA: DUF2336 domain-containing protein [Caulobacteraceae bacterium]|jgi:uncharacterized protein (DUF2336 family)|nr:DUF2336 domain-containing protein [Caulobacteraceae bacterium]
MTTTRSSLSDGDIRLLLKGAEPEERALVAHRLCRHIDRANLTDEERAEAHQILRLMARDAAEQVRRALAVTLKASPLIPRDVANRLARDVESIAVPMLNFSPVFSDEDLAEIVRVGGPVRQCAIARRPVLTEVVTTTIAEVGVSEAVQAACDNRGAAFSERGLQAAIDRFTASETVLASIALRNALPASVTERLVTLVTGELRERLISGHEVTPQTALAVAIGTRERASLDLVEQAARAADLPAFVAHLRRGQRLTASLMLRALAAGQMSFFEWGLAELSGVPHHRTWLMVHDAGELGLKAIYERAGLPGRLLPAFRAAVDAFHGMEFDGRPDDVKRFQRRMLERFLSQPIAISKEDVDYLLDKIDELSVEAAGVGETLEQNAA